MSEFPETTFSKFGKKIGWVFSPFLLLSLIIFTLVTAEGLNIGFSDNNVSIERKGSIEIKELKDAEVYLDGDKKEDTPNIYDTTRTERPATMLITKESRTNWTKQITVKSGFVRTYYPILYPQELDFKDKQTPVNSTFHDKYSGSFFYEKRVNNRVLLYKYAISKQILGISEKENLFRDLTPFVSVRSPIPSIETTTHNTFKEYSVIPNHNGTSVLLVVYNEAAYILDDSNTRIRLKDIVPQKEHTFRWSPKNNYILFQSDNDIYSIEVSSNRFIVIHRSNSSKDLTEVQFLLGNGLVYKLKKESITDLVQNSFEGNEAREIELPNFDNIRTHNLDKAYDLLEKQNLILIQSADNIYSFDVTNADFKKFNRFEGEKVIFTDAINEVVVTINDNKRNQFRFYDLDQEESKTFTLEGNDETIEPRDIIGYNVAQNLVLVYESSLEFIDIDGSNRYTVRDLRSPELVQATKLGDYVQYVLRETIEQSEDPVANHNDSQFADLDNHSDAIIRTVQASPTPSPGIENDGETEPSDSPPPTSEPTEPDTNINKQTENPGYIVRYEAFEN